MGPHRHKSRVRRPPQCGIDIQDHPASLKIRELSKKNFHVSPTGASAPVETMSTLVPSRALTFGAMQSPAALLDAAAAGDQSAWDGLVEQYGRLVWSVVRSFRLDDATAADVSQTVWLRLVENLSKIRDPERLPSWLATTARRESIRVSNRQRRQIPTEFEYDIEDPDTPEFDERLIQTEEHEALAAALQELDADCVQLLKLLSTDPPLDYATVAEILDRPVGSIGPTRGRCLDRLRRQLEAQEARGRKAGQ